MAPRIAPARWPPIAFAHRGARAEAPENTLAAFELAVTLGATGLETDVWVTADGEVVCDHDGWHGRVPGVRRRIDRVRRADLAEHVPTIDEVYRRVGTGLPLSVDVKDPAAFEPLVEVARRHGAEDQLWVCHPDVDLLATWRDRSPTIRLVNSTRLGRIEEGPERRGARLVAARIDAINLHREDWTGGLTTLFHRFDLLVFGWDAQQPRHLAELIDVGVDGLYSDHVERMVAAIAAVDGPR